MEPDVNAIKRIRGGIVEVLYTRHAQQQHRVDHVALWHILQDLGFDLGENDVLTNLQDLSDRRYVSFEQKRDRRTNSLSISMIQLTARGRDLREGTIDDPAVIFLRRRSMAASKRRPATGEKRKTNQPLKIDRLPVEVRDAIQYLKNGRLKTWQEIEELSALPYNKEWQSKGGGFVNWEELPTPVLELFPDLRLPHTNLHRWYDLRISQVTAETIRRSENARVLAKAFTKSIVKGDDEAVLNAARDQIMSLLAEGASQDTREGVIKALIALAQRMQTRRLNDLRERKVGVDERQIRLLEEREALTRRKLEAEAEKATKKLQRGKLKPEDLADLVQRTFGIAPPAEAARGKA